MALFDSMDNNDLTEHIKNSTWYRQAVSSNLYYAYAPFDAYIKLMGPIACFAYFANNFHEGYFDIDRSFEMARATLKQVRKNRATIDEIHAKWEALRSEHEKKVGRVNEGVLQTLDTDAFIEFQRDFLQSWCALWMISLYVEPFDPSGEALLEEEIQKAGVRLSKNEIDTLVTPNRPLFHAVFEAMLASIALNNYERKDQLLKMTDEVSYRDNRIIGCADLQKKYFWKKNDWGNACAMTEYDFFIELVPLFTKSKQELGELIERVETHSKDIAIRKKEIIDKHSLSEELQNIFYLFAEMTLFRDQRKINMQKTAAALDAMLEYMADRTGLEKGLLRNVYVTELSSLDFSDDYVDLLKEREQGSMQYADSDGGYMNISGKQAQDIHDLLEQTYRQQHAEIVGTTGCGGKAAGTVKVINTPEEFGKMEQGDVLVAPMTRPEYVPLMKKAAAIVTDEGGIACHAAIVSRELGIPCIIGSQIATKALHDGDIVEVDADSGQVRMIEEK
ncbi:MAG: PEP-utilizing enzyme [Candidatus Kerfeldbacteria bacterium]